MKPPVPTQPEPLDALRARYPRALEPVYDVPSIVDGGIRPGECAANIFDFEDGLRLIVSRERMPEGDILLHFSASFPAECRMADEFRLLKLTTPHATIMEMWRRDVPRRFAELSGDTRPCQLVGTSDRGIPHWIVDPPESRKEAN